MAAIHHAAFPPAEAWAVRIVADLLALPGVFGLIDPRGGMAMARVAADEAEMLTFAVLPGQRRQGVGTALLDAVMLTAAARGALTMVLEVSAENAPARALYGRAGFAAVGRRAAYYGQRADAIILRAALRPAAPPR